MLRNLVVVLVVLSTDIASNDATSRGADPSSCVSMIPSHGGSAPQNGFSPYQIWVEKTTYTPGSQLTVILKPGATPFKGFLIKAREVATGSSRGSFSPVSGTKQICSGNTALTHDGSTLFRNDLRLVWTAPPFTAGNIEFLVTFVQSFRTFWVLQKSSMITDGATSNTPAPNAPTSFQITPFVTTTCGTTKGCYRHPIGCAEPNCDAMVTWADAGSNVNFELMGKSSGYVALGMSTDQSMGDDSVTDCKLFANGAVEVQNSINTDKVNSDLRDAIATGIYNAKGSYRDGILRCTFSRSKITSNSNIKHLGNNYYLLIAVGRMSGGYKLKHSLRPFVSPDRVAFSVYADIPSATDAQGCQSANRCHQDAQCTDTQGGGYVCSCPLGWTGDGYHCEDIDECSSTQLNSCNSDARCTNTRGSFTCSCPAGYTGDGYTCIDIDECSSSQLNSCGTNAQCTNTRGSYTCHTYNRSTTTTPKTVSLIIAVIATLLMFTI